MKARDRKDLFPGALELMVLQSLRQEARHGYALAQHIKRASNELKSTLDEEIRLEERRSTERQEPPHVPTPVDATMTESTGTDHSIGNVPRHNGSA